MAKKFLTLAFLICVLLPYPAFAVAVEAFFTDEGGTRHFSEEASKFTGKVGGCGYIFAEAFNADVVIKGSALQKRKDDLSAEQIKSNSPHNFISHVEVGAGKVGEDKTFNKYLLDKVTMTSSWLSREVNLAEFPSDNLQLGGHFVQKMLFTGFTLNVFVPSLGGDAGYNIPISAKDINNDAKQKYLDCISTITK